MCADSALYRVHEGPLRVPIARRKVSRVAVSPGHITLELTSARDPLTSTVDLFAIESLDLGRSAATPHPVLGPEAGALGGLLGRRVTSCVATPDGCLDLRIAGSASVRSDRWNVGLGDGRHWTPHVDGRVAEWRPGAWQPAPAPRRPRPERRVDATAPLMLAGQQLRAISFRERVLGLGFAAEPGTQPSRSIERLPDVEVELKGHLTFEPGGRVVDAAAPPSAAPLLSLIGTATIGSTASPDGTLEIRLADGAVLTAGARDGDRWVVDPEDPAGWCRGGGGSARFTWPGDDRPLSGTRRAELVRAYLEYSATDRPDLFWASDRLRDLTWQAPEDAYDVIRELVRGAPSPYVLEIVAAGPLEDLLSDWGERFIDRLEADARADPKLLAACGGVWKNYMPDQVWTRLRSLVTGQVRG
jgi:hypothetical protein